MNARVRQAFVVLAIAAVLLAVIGGLFLLGSPLEERERRLDDRRVGELRGIASAVDLYWTRRGRLPDSLAELSQQQGIPVARSDPGTGRSYGYRILGKSAYEICAEFTHGTAEQGRTARGDFWAHGAGEQCFRLEAQTVER